MRDGDPVTPVEQKVILHGVSWETYERLLNEHQESPVRTSSTMRGNWKSWFCPGGTKSRTAIWPCWCS